MHVYAYLALFLLFNSSSAINSIFSTFENDDIAFLWNCVFADQAYCWTLVLKKCVWGHSIMIYRITWWMNKYSKLLHNKMEQHTSSAIIWSSITLLRLKNVSKKHFPHLCIAVNWYHHTLIAALIVDAIQNWYSTIVTCSLMRKHCRNKKLVLHSKLPIILCGAIPVSDLV